MACTPAEENNGGFLAGTSPVTSVSSGTGTATTSTTSGTTDTGDESGDGDSDNSDTTTTDGDSSTDSSTDDTTTETTDASNAFCGDSVVEGFEACDCGADAECTFEELGSVGCEDIIHPGSGNPYGGGVLGCNLSCQHDTSGCFVCGDGIKEDTEPCDGTEFGDSTCGSEGFLGGSLACTAACELDTSGCSMANWSDDFETGDFSGGAYTFGGTGQWSVGTDQASSGSFSAGSATITHSQTTEMSLTFTFSGPGTIAFLHKEDCESSFDDLQFLIGSTLQQEWSGSNDWTDSSFPVTAGTHTFTWRYSKDGSVNSGADKVWVDDIRTDGLP